MQTVLDAYPSSGVIQGNIKNEYNEISRECVLNSIKESEKLDNTLAFSHALMLLAVYAGMCNVTQLFKAPFRREEGGHQSAIKSKWFISLGVKIDCHPRLRAEGGARSQRLSVP